MNCPKCGGEMTYYEGEDEFGGDTLMGYYYWFCFTCGLIYYGDDIDEEEKT